MRCILYVMCVLKYGKPTTSLRLPDSKLNRFLFKYDTDSFLILSGHPHAKKSSDTGSSRSGRQ